MGEFESASDSTKVRTVKMSPGGELSCNCPGWIFKRGAGERRCRHIDKAWEEGWVAATAEQIGVSVDAVAPRYKNDPLMGFLPSTPQPVRPTTVRPTAAPPQTTPFIKADLDRINVEDDKVACVRQAVARAGVYLDATSIRRLAAALSEFLVITPSLPVATIAQPGRRRMVFD